MEGRNAHRITLDKYEESYIFSPSVCPTGSHLPRHTRPQAGVRECNRTKCGF